MARVCIVYSLVYFFYTFEPLQARTFEWLNIVHPKNNKPKTWGSNMVNGTVNNIIFNKLRPAYIHIRTSVAPQMRWSNLDLCFRGKFEVWLIDL